MKTWQFKVVDFTEYEGCDGHPGGIILIGDVRNEGFTVYDLPRGVHPLRCVLVAGNKVLMPLSLSVGMDSHANMIRGLNEFGTQDKIPKEYLSLIESGLFVRLAKQIEECSPGSDAP